MTAGWQNAGCATMVEADWGREVSRRAGALTYLEGNALTETRAMALVESAGLDDRIQAPAGWGWGLKAPTGARLHPVLLGLPNPTRILFWAVLAFNCRAEEGSPRPLAAL